MIKKSNQKAKLEIWSWFKKAGNESDIVKRTYFRGFSIANGQLNEQENNPTLQKIPYELLGPTS